MAKAGFPRLVSIGYEGRDVRQLVERLKLERVDVLVDVRLTPLSRKPGLSKTKLAAALADSGIAYVHHRALGNPKDNREGYRSGIAESFGRFRAVLESEQGQSAVGHVVKMLDDAVVALLCFERDHRSCHRDLVASAVGELLPNLAVSHI
ncbi:hypothetical protein CH274_14655 [Rhodococcus sp. 06-418-5]|uniref:DUF488 domain-containing protein n=1 Tax=Rhodococcus sp. 06-418-5 TaxID=2022507 RepID=UPI000B9ABA5D|nr:DUF488 domain-containing protein [Rhodococcus sp. 06-418-5]OZC80423.1 hypothetical protein CH274_14655 [Rhodococcus sp. 06-418-5]